MNGYMDSCMDARKEGEVGERGRKGEMTKETKNKRKN
jgi:hypothetical protein